MSATLVELPIDHFRLLGVSPSAETESVLRTLQLRLDRCPNQGFTHEVLMQRAELLRLSADLLSDAARRQDYERPCSNWVVIIRKRPRGWKCRPAGRSLV